MIEHLFIHTFPMLGSEPVSTMKEADEIIEFYIQPGAHLWHRWILVEKETGVQIGTCGFHCWDQATGTCDVGYDLYPNYWGKGYMRGAMQMILDFAQDEMNISPRSIADFIFVINQ